MPDDIHDVSRVLFPYIEGFYSRTRLHSALNSMTPAEKQSQALQTGIVA